MYNSPWLTSRVRLLLKAILANCWCHPHIILICAFGFVACLPPCLRCMSLLAPDHCIVSITSHHHLTSHIDAPSPPTSASPPTRIFFSPSPPTLTPQDVFLNHLTCKNWLAKINYHERSMNVAVSHCSLVAGELFLFFKQWIDHWFQYKIGMIHWWRSLIQFSHWVQHGWVQSLQIMLTAQSCCHPVSGDRITDTHFRCIKARALSPHLPSPPPHNHHHLPIFTIHPWHYTSSIHYPSFRALWDLTVNTSEVGQDHNIAS